MKIYAASSWRNPWQPPVVTFLRSLGHEVYDFRNPPGGTGFGWREIDPEWRTWSPEVYRQMLNHPRAVDGFRSDFDAMKAADACVLIQPCGTSAHLELGWCAAAAKRTAVLFPFDIAPDLASVGHADARPCPSCGYDGCRLPARLRSIEPELMVKIADCILLSSLELQAWVG